MYFLTTRSASLLLFLYLDRRRPPADVACPPHGAGDVDERGERHRQGVQGTLVVDHGRVAGRPLAQRGRRAGNGAGRRAARGGG